MQATLRGATGGTELSGINNAGDIVGAYFDSTGHSHGFIASTGTISFVPLAYSPDTASTIIYAAEYGTLPDPTETFKLIGFTTPQYTYGQQIGVIDPAIYAYESLGATLASGASHFQNTYVEELKAVGCGNIFKEKASGAKARGVKFGRRLAEGAVQADLARSYGVSQATMIRARTDDGRKRDQLSFLESIYTASGSFGSPTNVDLIARGAVYGQMLASPRQGDSNLRCRRSCRRRRSAHPPITRPARTRDRAVRDHGMVLSPAMPRSRPDAMPASRA
jgi:hypothetical protein